MIGQTIAHFRITEKIGAGGMGEVYRAVDSRLGRDVALKILPQAFAADEERMARFEREAQLLAALNHPHIATIFGLEVSGTTRALIMELVEGPTLAQRIAQGPLSFEEALPIARQMAEALEYAHERGIIHRDLKPANVKLTPSGAVKLLDFGLAKALVDDPASDDPSNSPTISAVATKAGVILGTAAYMSPEQAKGKPVDRRADIWSFGVVFYEMLSGKALYRGETAPKTLAHVITKEPRWNDLPSSTPQQIRRLLERCLTKEPRQRLRDIGEARIAIEQSQAHLADDAPSGAPASVPVAAVAQPVWRRMLPWAVTALLGIACLALLTLWRPWSRAAGPGVTFPIRISGDAGAAGTLLLDYGPAVVLSPDGTHIAFVVRNASGKQQIYLRSLDQLQVTPLAGTEGAHDPFFSPDGQWIAFFAGGQLKKISVQGGAAVTLCGADGRGGAWSEDGTIILARGGAEALSRVSSAGGTPEPLTTLDRGTGETTHRWPQVLPGGKAVLFTANAAGINFEDSTVVVQMLSSGERKTVYRGGYYGRYLPSGQLMFMHEGTLFAMPFDLKQLGATGQAAPVVDQVISSGLAGAQFSFSDTGTLAYVGGTSASRDLSILWLSRDGKTAPRRQAPAEFTNPSLSPDGKRLAIQILEKSRNDIWVGDLQRDTLTRLTFGGDVNTSPIWTPDGKRITYAMSEKGKPLTLYWKRADGSGEAQRLSESSGVEFAGVGSWRPDGKVLVFYRNTPGSPTGDDLYTMTMEGNEIASWKPGEPKPFLVSPADEFYPEFSPDGRWIAYTSNESGPREIYVRPFPGPGGKWQISSGGGHHAQWSRSGRELFYDQDDQIMVVPYTTSGDSFEAGKPTLWSETRIVARGRINFAMQADGKRAIVFEHPAGESAAQANKITFVFNFFDELRRKFSAK